MASPWVAIDSTTDRHERARSLAVARESVLAGAAPSGVVRDVIGDSWERCRDAGVDADGAMAPVPVAEDDARARWEAHPLAAAVPAVRELLGDVGNAAHQVLLFCDADGTLLWIEGEHTVLSRAREAHLRPGAVWSENVAGTNAMGTALATGHPVQVFSAEHYARPVHDWTCSAAPVHDPDSGQAVGVLDLSGALDTAHPHSLAVVSAAARIVEQELRRAADEAAAQLVDAFGDRIGHGPSHPHALTTVTGRVLLSARDGLTGRRIALPPEGGVIALPGGGAALAEPLPGGRGFLLWSVSAREASAEPAATATLEILGRDRARLTVGGQTHTLSPRHSELLLLMSLRPSGWRAEQLAAELLGDFGKPVSIRAELSRLRRILGPLLLAQPYRLSGPLSTDVAVVEALLAAGDVPAALERFSAGELLPGSDAPTIAEARFRLTMSVREAVIAAADPELLRGWLQLPAGDDDAQACRALMALCPPADPRHALAAGRLRRLAGAR